MRKSILLSAIGLVICLSLSTHAATYGGGNGTPDDPYQITDANDLNAIGVNPADWDKHFKLMANIDMSIYTGTQYNIIGNSTTQFTGSFDGNGYVISNLTYTVNTTADGYEYVGLFGYTDNAEIKNLGIEDINFSVRATFTQDGYGVIVGGLVGYQSSGAITNCCIAGMVSSSSTYSPSYAGGLVGYQSSGAITNCCIAGTVSSSSTYSPSYAGGLAGWSSGTITNCYSTSVVSARGYNYPVYNYSTSYAGGLVGYQSSGSITNCYSTGTVSSSSDSTSYAGGLVGWSSGAITNCYSTGMVSTSAQANYSCYAGGVVGYQFSGSITNCHSTGKVYSHSYYGASYVGGIAGSSSGIITNCYSTGEVSAYASDGRSYVGGIAGDSSVAITNCYSTGEVSAFSYSQSYAGGLVGRSSGTITNCYSTGGVSVDGNVPTSYAGGLVGWSSGTIANCYSAGAVSAISHGRPSYAGGLVGWSSGTITNCYSTGMVLASSYSSSPSSVSYAGGLVGCCSGTIMNCYSTGTVSSYSASSASYAGGLVAYQANSTNARIEKCYSTGEVSATGDNVYTGGLLGYKDGSDGIVTACFWDTQTSGMDTSAGGSGVQGKTTSAMKTLLTFTNGGWDFTNETANGTNDYWRMCVDGVEYPRLAWEFSKQGDFVCPDGVFAEDLEYFVQRWLSNNCADSNDCQGADITADGAVNLADCAIIAAHWLEYPVYPYLVGWWEFSKTSGILANDSSWYGNHGTLINGPVWTGDGKLSFDGIDDYVEVGHSASLDISNEITVSAWIYLNDYGTDWPKVVIKPHSAYADPWEMFNLDLGQHGTYPRFIITDGIAGGELALAYDDTITLNLNQWYYIAGTYNGSTIVLYLDGQLIDSSPASIAIGQNSMPVSIGGRLGINNFNGLIDEVRIYNRALTETEVQNQYQNH